MSQSHACCTVPPVVEDNYSGKGDYITIEGMKTYATGPKDAKKALLVIYDIFGFFPQTIQGADILAYGDSKQNYQVFIPDFFDGKPADISWYPPDNEEKGKKLGEFFQTLAAPPKTLERIPKVISALQSERSSIQEWGVVGYCWGGKIVNLSSQQGSPFKAAAACHPAMVDPNDAPGVTIPYAMLPSKGESKDDVAKWESGLKVKKLVKWYDDQEHGFMAARAELKDSNVKAKYEDAYQTLLNWFHEHL
ncbi:alpha/beta-hydrolase [Polychaeton citri CBS 116435]|uniref:Alpha/beta-hydrolase n=1 Tax=Polychaeton citri CBS 116435 TaxID=1314669 RepID=A0A9P4UQP7_9PEZI|nr:alpha/beta-hydrolase [Polychaeton citri CBS 116435]